ncbi:MAG: HAMP domain-containing sensor histidine kinase [Hyphomicrobium sp.]|nr:HAMP domain-containing sensor histidine kinase [Hyphomicrobium sp.]
MSEYSSLLGDAVLRHRTRAAEHAARIEAELASRVKSEFIANMSHELRTPLNTMIGFSKIICEHDRRRLSDSEIVEYAGLIRDSAGHLLAVINDILDISKMQSGRYTLDARETNIDEVLSATIAALKMQAQEAEVAVSLNMPPNLPVLRGDPTKLRQVFTNIISNAIKFTLKGGSVKVEAIRRANGSVAVAVRDTGIGMSEDDIRIALTPFGQVDGTRTRWREGTGLGLPIAKTLVELHGGELMVRSKKGHGTEILVVLPPGERVTVQEARDAVLGIGHSHAL